MIDLNQSEVMVTEYAYTLQGRLSEVRMNRTVSATYNYDANGNRLSHNADVGIYDAQDRMLACRNPQFYSWIPTNDIERQQGRSLGIRIL